MRHEAYRSMVAAVILEHKEENQRAQCKRLLEHLREICDYPEDDHTSVVEDCLNYKSYNVDILTQLSPNEKLVLHVLNNDGSKSRDYVVNSGEKYNFNLGGCRERRVRFAVAKYNGESRRAVVRKGSLLKRMVTLDRREEDSVELWTLPLGVVARRAIVHRAHTYHVDITVTREEHPIECCALEFGDVLDLARALYEWEADDEDCYDGELGDYSFPLWHTVLTHYQLPHIVMKIAALCVFLVWPDPAPSGVLTRLLSQIKACQLTPATSQTRLFSDAMSHLNDCLLASIDDLLGAGSEKAVSIALFPPTGPNQLAQLNQMIKLASELCCLDAWDEVDELDPAAHLAATLTRLIHNSCTCWARDTFDLHASPDVDETGKVAVSRKDSLPPPCMLLHGMFKSLVDQRYAADIFFNQFSIHYLAQCLIAIDEQLETFVRDLVNYRLAELDGRESKSLEAFTRTTMRLFHSLKELTELAEREGVSVPLRLFSFESWFGEAPVFWSHTWAELSGAMVARTISLEDDGVSRKYESRRPLPAGLYSFLCIQKGLSDDFHSLRFRRPENLIMATMRLVNIYSENLVAYARKLFAEADMRATEGAHSERCPMAAWSSVVLCRWVRAANGIDQALQYLEEHWRRFVDADRLVLVVGEEEAKMLEKAAGAIVAATKQRCSEYSDRVVAGICERKEEEVDRLARELTIEGHEYKKALKSYVRDVSSEERMDAVLRGLDAAADEMRAELLPRRAEKALERIGQRFMREVKATLRSNQLPDYYGHIYMALKEVPDILGVECTDRQLIALLHIKSFSTSELILSYYGDLCELAENRGDNLPMVKLQLAQRFSVDEKKEEVEITVHVHGTSPLATVCSSSGRADPFVRLELLPRYLFPASEFKVHRSRVVSHTLRPMWAQTFKICLPRDLFFTHGTTLCVAVMDHDRFKRDKLMGRTFISLNKIPSFSSALPPPVEYPLFPSNIGNKIPYFQIIAERASIDPMARDFHKRERRARELQLRCLPRLTKEHFL